MAKYTLGAIAAIVIVGATAFYILARLNDSNAETLPAPPVTVVFLDPGPAPQTFDFALNRPTEIRLENRSDYARAIVWDGAEVEQLSNIKQAKPGAPPTPRLYIEAPPRKTASASVRFTEPGAYTLKVIVPGVASSFDITAVVK